MRRDIFLTTKQLTISTTPCGGFEIPYQRGCSISRDELLRLFDHYDWVTLVVEDAAAEDECYAIFASQFTAVLAAGGVVRNSRGETLMIYRNGRWDLPKGHWEVGESIEECAVREVEEETGIGEITIGAKLCETIHAYQLRGVWEIKCTHWYSMTSDDTHTPKPQTEEGIERVAWCDSEYIEQNIKDSFPTIQHVISEYKASINR